jgi:hypothetical protein
MKWITRLALIPTVMFLGLCLIVFSPIICLFGKIEYGKIKEKEKL